ncbi:MAG: type II secretion system protein [Halofilum sp. (in: g-proteobacteria)]|nr:type II secretion system protein [Halofilum sp. (in: g-proteobacteria)]
MGKQQSGFTLIELVAVIVILGAMTVLALPRFISLQDEAESAAISGIQGAASAAHALNRSAALTGDGNEIRVESCAHTSKLLQGDYADYTFDSWRVIQSPGGGLGRPRGRGLGRPRGGNQVFSDGDPLNCGVYRTRDGTGAAVRFTGYAVVP